MKLIFKSLFILLTFSSLQVFSQTESSKAKLALLRQTVIFLSKVQPKSKSDSCLNQEASTFENLKKCAENTIDPGKLFDKFGKTEIENEELKLETFGEGLVSFVTDGKEKEKRKTLPVFKEYETALAEIIKVANQKASPVTEEKPDTQIEPVLQPIPTEKSNDFPVLVWIWMGLLTAGLAGIAFLAISQLNNLKEKLSRSEEKLRKAEDKSWETEKRISIVDTKIEDFKPQIQRLSDEIVALQRKSEIQKPVEIPVQQTFIPSNPVPVIKQNTKKYSLYPDRSDGFSSAYLKDEATSATVYELEILSETQASFQIYYSQTAQADALNDPSQFLEKACDYQNAFSANSRIVTVESGKAMLQNGIWVISQKAKIRFE